MNLEYDKLRVNGGERLTQLRERVLAYDSRECFIERETILLRLEAEMASYNHTDKYAKVLSVLLNEVSTPLYPEDYFAGRIVQALPEDGMQVPRHLISSMGHLSPDYRRILTLGLRGILEEIESTAADGNEEEHIFAENARIVIEGIRVYANRYADEAVRCGKDEMARALRIVPYEPAYDFYSALQSIWLIHLIASCYVGSRDYAFGRMDQYLQPYYEKSLSEGVCEEELIELLAGFMMKCNEMCGRTSWVQPILSNLSKQYINIGGSMPTPVSFAVLKAIQRVGLAQPTVIVLLEPEADRNFTKAVFKALEHSPDQIQLYHYTQVVQALLNKGIPLHIAQDVTFSACCTLDLHYHTYRQEYFVPAPHIFWDVLMQKHYNGIDEILTDYAVALRADIQSFVDVLQNGYDADSCRRYFVLDSILLTDYAKACHYPGDNRSPYHVLNIFFPGLATVGDSLMVLDRLVFREHRLTYDNFMEILRNNYTGEEMLRKEILSMTKFGNDTVADDYTVKVGELFADVVDGLNLQDNFVAIPGYYSIDREVAWKDALGATPDGRHAGDLFSENQSPSYGADKNGLTALLNSMAKLPFHRAISGGLNLTFSSGVTAEILEAVLVSYLQNGGLHAGVSVIDRETLCDAMIHPEAHQTLLVRLYGFSEYFTRLPDFQQRQILMRTEYAKP